MSEYCVGDYAEARRRLEASMAIRQEVGDRYAIALVVGNLGLVAAALGEPDEALRLLETCLAMHQEIGDQGGIASTLNNLGFLAQQRQDFEAARRCFHEALRTASQAGILPNVVESLVGLAAVLASEGQAERAAALLAPALAHPAAEAQIRARAQALMAELHLSRPPNSITASPPAAEGLDLDGIVDGLLRSQTLAPSQAPPPT